MKKRLTDRYVSGLKPPASGHHIWFDSDIPGFGVRITSAGYRAWVLDYRIDGRQRRYTLGKGKAWSAKQARLEATRLRREVDLGRDPMGEREAARKAPTVAELADRFMAEYVRPKRRASTADSYQGLVNQHITQALGKRRVDSLTHAEVDAWHQKIAKNTPYRANRALAVLSKMLSLACTQWEMRTDNPCKGIERSPEDKRSRYANSDELRDLLTALASAEDRQMAKAALLLALTGARRSEVLNANWAQFDMARGTWTKPASTTKQNKAHSVPLSTAALAVLASLARAGPELFSGGSAKNRHPLRDCWERARLEAGCPDLRLHDLRHTFASVLASQPGASLPLIGAMLGHSTPSTTHRYAHLFDDPQRAAAERVGQFIEAAATGKQAEVINLKAAK